ncbi:MAG: DUF2809 domain-containing protein [Propionicimonas sp.]
MVQARLMVREGRVRLLAGVVALVTIAAGMLARPLPVVGDALGGIAYTLLLALLVVLVWPAGRPWVAAALATAVSFAVELLQLTRVPGRLTDLVPPLRWVLGSTFAWEDLLWYFAGGLVAIGVLALIRRVSRREPDGTGVHR